MGRVPACSSTPVAKAGGVLYFLREVQKKPVASDALCSTRRRCGWNGPLLTWWALGRSPVTSCLRRCS